MIKALSAIAIAAFIAAALTVLPGFAPQVEASVNSSIVLKKADRLDYRADRQGLLAAGVAEFRAVLPAQRRHQDGAGHRFARFRWFSAELTTGLQIGGCPLRFFTSSSKTVT